MTTREDVFNALFALGANLAWGAPVRTFAYASRRVKLWSDAPVQPALFQAEPFEDLAETTRLPPKTTYSANWVIYHDVGKAPDAVPATETNLILDAVQAAFPDEPDQSQTLGGLVHHCFISGRIMKDAGDLDGQALIVVPIKILVP